MRGQQGSEHMPAAVRAKEKRKRGSGLWVRRVPHQFNQLMDQKTSSTSMHISVHTDALIKMTSSPGMPRERPASMIAS